MRAFVLFLIFLALLAQLYLFARNYAGDTASEKAPMAERELGEHASHAAVEKKPENPVRGIEALQGVVLGEDRAPIAGAEVTIIETDLKEFDAHRVPRKRDTWVTTSGSDGAFSVNTLAPGGYVVQCASPGRGTAAAVTTLEARGIAGEVVLRPTHGRKVAGAVFDWEGRPVKGARVFVLGPSDAAPELAPYRYLPATTEADGSFVFASIPAIQATYLAVADDLAPAIIRDAEQADGRPAPLRFTLGKGVRLAGYLTEADTARPADKTAVLITETEFGMERVRKYSSGAASFLFENLRQGTYEVRVESSRYALETRPLILEVKDGLGNLDVRLVKAGRVKGRVLQEDGREGVPGIRIVATSTDGKEMQAGDSGASGYYSLEGLAPGTWKISAENPHGDVVQTGEATVTIDPGRTVTGPSYSVARGATISGRVLDESGRPVIGANIFVSLDGDRTEERSTRTAEDGRFEQSGIPPESEVRIWAERLGKVSVALGPEKVSAAGLHELTFTLSETALAEIGGVVVDTLGRPAADVTVHCFTPDVSLSGPLSHQTGSDGAFRFEGLSQGAYRVLAGRSPGHMAAESEQQVSLTAGQRLESLRLVLP